MFSYTKMVPTGFKVCIKKVKLKQQEEHVSFGWDAVELRHELLLHKQDIKIVI